MHSLARIVIVEGELPARSALLAGDAHRGPSRSEHQRRSRPNGSHRDYGNEPATAGRVTPSMPTDGGPNSSPSLKPWCKARSDIIAACGCAITATSSSTSKRRADHGLEVAQGILLALGILAAGAAVLIVFARAVVADIEDGTDAWRTPCLLVLVAALVIWWLGGPRRRSQSSYHPEG